MVLAGLKPAVIEVPKSTRNWTIKISNLKAPTDAPTPKEKCGDFAVILASLFSQQEMARWRGVKRKFMIGTKLSKQREARKERARAGREGGKGGSSSCTDCLACAQRHAEARVQKCIHACTHRRALSSLCMQMVKLLLTHKRRNLRRLTMTSGHGL